MLLPPLAALIRAAVDARSRETDVPAKGARRHGGIPLADAFLIVYFLRPDGSIWEVDMEADKAVARPVPPEQHVRLLAAGAKRYPWLAELLPKVPAGATLCPDCRGEGEIHPGPVRQIHGVVCPHCDGLGWRPAQRHDESSQLAAVPHGT